MKVVEERKSKGIQDVKGIEKHIGKQQAEVAKNVLSKMTAN